jgi:DNA polymerase (family X)
MPNEQIAEYFSFLAKLMDIHGENSFKTKTYANAAFQIEKLEVPLHQTPRLQWEGLKGIGANTAAKIEEIISTGTLTILDHYVSKTPEGIIEMLAIKGLGPKKIHSIWKEMDIESIGELLYACNENRLTLYKGFGEKTQQNVKDAILFLMAQKGKFLYQQALPFADIYQTKLEQLFGDKLVGITSDMRRKMETIDTIAFLITGNNNLIAEAMKSIGHMSKNVSEATLEFEMEQSPSLTLHACTHENAGSVLMQTTGSKDFIEWVEGKLGKSLNDAAFENEEAIFAAAGMDYIAPQHRDVVINEEYYQKHIHKNHASPSNIHGIIHSHSKWSDGSNTLEEMVMAAKSRGLSYLVISDHSKAASYAGGLREEQILSQHKEIDHLNIKHAPFKIFKSIECDILGNGQLDYNDEILASFDLVIASIHSSLKMSEEKAMQRLITAIENPFTLILGHMTGRLLLSRNGYPVDHKKIIDACAANQVAIELNAHPRRLDLDWRWIPYALEKDVLISINPDAHSTEGFDDIKYGCIAAEKALLPASANLSSFTLPEFEQWLYDVRSIKGTLVI